MPSPVVYLAPIVFAAVCAQRLVTWRRAGSGRRILTRRHLTRLVTATLLASGLGLILISLIAAVLLANYQRERHTGGDFSGLQTIVFAIGAYVVVVPLASWLGMRLLPVRPAGLAAFGAWGLLGVALMLAQMQIPGGKIQSAWFYGLVAVIPYAIAAAAVACVPAESSRQP